MLVYGSKRVGNVARLDGSFEGIQGWIRYEELSFNFD